MTRAEQIARLEGQYAQYVHLGKRKRSGEIYARLRALKMRQLNDELMLSDISKDMAIAAGDLDAATEVYGG